MRNEGEQFAVTARRAEVTWKRLSWRTEHHQTQKFKLLHQSPNNLSPGSSSQLFRPWRDPTQHDLVFFKEFGLCSLQKRLLTP